jgi:hypothetical protein
MTKDRIRGFAVHTQPNGSTDNAKIKFCKDDLRFILEMAEECVDLRAAVMELQKNPSSNPTPPVKNPTGKKPAQVSQSQQ